MNAAGGLEAGIQTAFFLIAWENDIVPDPARTGETGFDEKTPEGGWPPWAA